MNNIHISNRVFRVSWQKTIPGNLVVLNFINNYIGKKIYKFNNKKIFYNKNYKIGKIYKKSFDIIINKKKFNFNKPALNGVHQIENAATAIASILEIKKIGKKINIESINKG